MMKVSRNQETQETVERSNRVTCLAAVVAIVASFIFGAGAAMAYEEPKYIVVHRGNGYEVRQYEDRLAVQTAQASSSDNAFGRLFRYISGANTGSAKINMTVPVARSEKIDMTVPVNQTTGTGGYMQFFLPDIYTIESAPIPTDPDVQIVVVSGGYFAVRRYNGAANERNFEKHRDSLMTTLQSDKVNVVGRAVRATYNGPFTPPFMRRNEVIVQVEWE